MSLFYGIFLLSIVLANYHVQASRYSHHDNDYESTKYLRQLLRELQLQDSKRLYHGTRAEDEGDCTANILQDYRWNGEESMHHRGVDTTQRCMDYCNMHTSCMGWTYKSESQVCEGFSSFNGVLPAPGTKCGSCVPGGAKQKCTEQRAGYYSNGVSTAIGSIGSVTDCMGKCDQSQTCFGYVYTASEQKCEVFTYLSNFVALDGYLGGICMGAQARVRLPESNKIFGRDALDRHNEKRKLHGVPELTKDADLTKTSQDLADKLAAEDKTPPNYQPMGMQTIFYGRADAAELGSRMVDCFYDEQKFYKYDKPDLSVASHFAKIIWKSSTKLGVGRAMTSDKETMFVVFTYDWQGDMGSSLQDNVPKKIA